MTAWILTLAASAMAGPVPMFTGRVPPPLVPGPPAVSAPATSGTRPTLRTPVAPGSAFVTLNVVPIEPGQLKAVTMDTRAEPNPAPVMRYVPSEPVKTRLAQTGQMTPIADLPSGLTPIQAAPNLLPVTQIRRLVPIDPAD